MLNRSLKLKTILIHCTLCFVLCTLTSCSDPSAGTGVPAFFSDAKEVSVGDYHTVAIDSEGKLWAWGLNVFGTLGDGSASSKSIPVQVKSDHIGADKWLTVSAGAYHTAAIDSNGKLWAWGDNNYGQLGVGDTTDRSIPVQVENSDSSPWKAVSAGLSHTAAIDSNGKLWVWGSNIEGQVGVGVPIPTITTVPVGTTDKWLTVSAGGMHTAAINSNGKLYAWGYNGSGQLGKTGYYDTPELIDSGSWKAVSAGWLHTAAIDSNGKLWAWGSNTEGQLGNDDNTGTDSDTPVQVKDPDPSSLWRAVSAELKHTVAIKENGSIWAWGNNEGGKLGDNSTLSRYRPVKIGDKWKAITAGSYHTAAIKDDGVLWGWGLNAYGQLGDGTTTDRKIPNRVVLSR